MSYIEITIALSILSLLACGVYFYYVDTARTKANPGVLIDGIIYGPGERTKGLIVFKSDLAYYSDDYRMQPELCFSCTCRFVSILTPIMPSVPCLISHGREELRDLYCCHCLKKFKNALIREICDEYGATLKTCSSYSWTSHL